MGRQRDPYWHTQSPAPHHARPRETLHEAALVSEPPLLHHALRRESGSPSTLPLPAHVESSVTMPHFSQRRDDQHIRAPQSTRLCLWFASLDRRTPYLHHAASDGMAFPSSSPAKRTAHRSEQRAPSPDGKTVKSHSGLLTQCCVR